MPKYRLTAKEVDHLRVLDVKDAFLMVPQDKPVKIKVGQEEFIVKRNLPGQRMGAKKLVSVLEGLHGEEAAVQLLH